MTTSARTHKPRDRTKTGQSIRGSARVMRAIDERVVGAFTASLVCLAGRVLARGLTAGACACSPRGATRRAVIGTVDPPKTEAGSRLLRVGLRPDQREQERACTSQRNAPRCHGAYQTT